LDKFAHKGCIVGTFTHTNVALKSPDSPSSQHHGGGGQ
jgi:hypothetical protein